MAPASGFECRNCKVLFTRKYSCVRHEEKCANISRPYNCVHCSTGFTKRNTIIHHLQKCAAYAAKNASKKSIQKSKAVCLMPNCNIQFYHRRNLLQHLKIVHSSEIVIEEKVSKIFASMGEFDNWKEKEEERTYSYFVVKSSLPGNKVKHYYCQHDGSPDKRPRKTTMRHSKGTTKLGQLCIAKMKISMGKNNIVFLDYYPTHNHPLTPEDIVYQPLPKVVNEYISGQVDLNAPADLIYENVKNIFGDKDAGVSKLKMNMVTKRKIADRCHRKRISQRLDENDAHAVFLKTKHLIEEDDIILMYKPFESVVFYGPLDINYLPNSKNLFLLGIQTERQRELIELHGGKILIVNKTQGTNQYKYELLTCMVVDDYWRPWPVAHLITSNSDERTLEFFFRAIREKVVDLNISSVITPDDSALINAMEQGFGKELRHILCTWHILKDWREKLKHKVPKEMVPTMLEELKAILDSAETDKFEFLCCAFMTKHRDNPNTSTFAKHFEEHYMTRSEKWGLCFRNFPYGSINTTAHVDSFHSRLKESYLKRNNNKRLDDLIDVLVNLEWDDYCTRLKETQGFSSLPQEIMNRHEKAISSEDIFLSQILENTWEVITKMGNVGRKYVIERRSITCDCVRCFCKCKTSACHGLCSHLYTCSCSDKHPLCKHVHKLHSLLNQDDNEDLWLDDGAYTFKSDQLQDSSADDEPSEVLGSSDADFVRNLKCSEIASSLCSLQAFEKYSHLSDSTLTFLAQTLSECVEKLKRETENVVKVDTDDPSAPNQTVKVEVSPVLCFERPPQKRKGVTIFSEKAQKRNKVVEDLLLHLL